jgi:hypothetical protein
MNLVELNEILAEAKRYESSKGMAVGRHPCRDKIRKAFFVGKSVYSIHKRCNERFLDTGDKRFKITEPALTSYRNDKYLMESVQVEFQNKRRIEKEKERKKEERNPGIDMCITVINLANKFLEEAKETNFEGLTESQWKLIDRGIAASKAIPILRKAEPDIFDYEEVALLDPESERLIKEVADDLARQIGDQKSVKTQS